MNKRTYASVLATLSLTTLLILAMVVAGCTNNANKTSTLTSVPAITVITTPQASVAQQTNAASLTTAPAASGPKQTLKVSGSTTVLPIAQAAADAFMATHPNADIQITGGGSGVGVQQIGEKSVDIGMSSRELSPTEKTKYPNLFKTVVAKDGIAIIVNPTNEIKVISAATAADIYTGKITKWSQVLGANVPNTNNQIVVIGRDSASGTRTFFDTDPTGILHGAAPTKSMLEMNSNGAVTQSVAQTPGAIGYISIGFVDKSVKALPIWWNDPTKAIPPTKATVLDKTYPINRELFMFTNGQPTGLAKDYLNFILSPDGQKIVDAQGYVSLT
ncbi:MAG: phosphate ABC transporter substrate-binding protein [Methanoregulaceae archaeon]|jgi:phosphate transport system substrate-binding protein